LLSIAANSCCNGSETDKVEADIVDDADDAEDEALALCCCIAIKVMSTSPLSAPCVLPVMPVPEQAGVDEVDVLAVSLDVLEEDEDVLPVIEDSNEASIWLALLAADRASMGSMAISEKFGKRQPEFFGTRGQANIMPVSCDFCRARISEKQTE
jgi:hypothetical protein